MDVNNKQLQEALKRHEENFEKELQEVDIRAVVLKTKKALLEQSIKNSSTYDHVLDQGYRINSLQSKVNSCETRLEKIELEIYNLKKIFTEAVELLQKQIKPEPKVGFLTKFGDFLKCLLK